MKPKLIERIDNRRTPACPHPPMAHLVSDGDGPTALYCIECKVMGSERHDALKGSFDFETFAGWLIFGGDGEYLEYEPYMRDGMIIYYRAQKFQDSSYIKAIAMTTTLNDALADTAHFVVQVGEKGIEWKKGEAEYAANVDSMGLLAGASIFIRATTGCITQGIKHAAQGRAPSQSS